jgi:intracellular septation protein A
LIKKRLAAFVRFILAEFAPLIGFLVLSQIVGLKLAITGTILIAIADTGWRLWKGVPFTRTYILFVLLTVGFGVIDLFSAVPFMLKYEAVVTNVVTGVVFGLSAIGPKPLVLEVAEQREGRQFTDDASRIFFRGFTLVWAAYFLLKAAFYFWVAWSYSMTEAIIVRKFVGSISLGLMLWLSYTQARRAFVLCQRWGLLPAVPEQG